MNLHIRNGNSKVGQCKGGIFKDSGSQERKLVKRVTTKKSRRLGKVLVLEEIVLSDTDLLAA